MVFYRKYRPQTISELDSAKLRETLTAVLSRPEIPHAFLLTGPKGLGKTSTARIIAKVVNCEHINEQKAPLNGSSLKVQASIEPDNTCEQCISITNGSNIDVLEIDGASNRGIDEIRDLRDKVKLAPSRAKKKVYIIDEVHMLTTEAFNALLKTIEEPPSHVMFLFCTTEPQKVPETILSRCLHIPYTLATEEDLVRSFKRIVEAEKIAITDEALRMIAQLADGGFRDGTKILEEVVMLANGQEITKELVEEKYKVSGVSYMVGSMLGALEKKDIKESFVTIAKLTEQGIDAKYFIGQLLEALHEMLLVQMGVMQDSRFKIQGSNLKILDIQLLVSLLSEAYQQAKYSPIPQLPLELVVVGWCSQNDQEPITNNQDNSAGFPIESGMTINTDGNKHTMDTLLKKEKNLKVQQILRGTPNSKGEDETKETKDKNGSVQEEMSDKRQSSEVFMENLIYKVKPLNHSVAGVLRGCGIKKIDDGQVILETSFKFHKEKLEEAKTKDILEQSVKEMTGKNLKVVIELKG